MKEIVLAIVTWLISCFACFEMGQRDANKDIKAKTARNRAKRVSLATRASKSAAATWLSKHRQR